MLLRGGILPIFVHNEHLLQTVSAYLWPLTFQGLLSLKCMRLLTEVAAIWNVEGQDGYRSVIGGPFEIAAH